MMFQHTRRTVLGRTFDAKHSIFGVHCSVDGSNVGDEGCVARMGHPQHSTTDKSPNVVDVFQVDIGANHMPGRFFRTGRVDDFKTTGSIEIYLNGLLEKHNNAPNVDRPRGLHIEKQSGWLVFLHTFVPVAARQPGVHLPQPSHRTHSESLLTGHRHIFRHNYLVGLHAVQGLSQSSIHVWGWEWFGKKDNCTPAKTYVYLKEYCTI